MKRLRRELADFAGYWAWPMLVALLPYRTGIALARFLARTLPLYDAAAQAGLVQYRQLCNDDDRRWLVDFRFAQLIDHADLFWALTRSRRFLHSLLDVPAAPGPGPLLVVSMHYGQGLWLLSWLRDRGLPARFLSMRFDAKTFGSSTHYAYARLRMWVVRHLSGVPPIYTGGAKQEIAATLRQGGAAYGLIDVPGADGRASPNAMLFQTPIHWPSGLVDCARDEAAALLLLTAVCEPGGRRHVEAKRVPAADVGTIATIFEQRIRSHPGAWHFWHLRPAFSAP